MTTDDAISIIVVGARLVTQVRLWKTPKRQICENSIPLVTPVNKGTRDMKRRVGVTAQRRGSLPAGSWLYGPSQDDQRAHKPWHGPT